MQINYVQILLYLGILLVLASYAGISSRAKKGRFHLPVGFLIVFFLFKIAIPVFRWVDLGSTAQSLDVAAAIVLWMAMARIAVYLIVDYFLRQKRGLAIPTITRDFGLAIFYIIIAMVVLKNKTDINLGSLLTTSAILTAIIGFAMQDTLGNLFSGLALQLEHPYQIGDWIGFEGMEGKVVSITWKSTKILTRSEELIFVPNNTIAKSTLTNFSRPTPKHITFLEVGTSYDDPPHKVKQAITETILNHPKVLASHPPLVIVTKYDDFSINYKAFFATEDFASEGKTRAEILCNLWYRFRRDKIKIPYPVQEEWQIMPSEVIESKRHERASEEMAIASMLGKIDIFAKLSPETRQDLTKRISILEFGPGEDIVVQGGEPGPMYIIKEGQCSVLVSHDDGAQKLEVARLKSVQFFGEMSVLTGAPRTATVRTVTHVICYEIEKEDMKAIFSNNVEALSRVSEILAEREAKLSAHKSKMEEEAALNAASQNQLMSKIKSFLGL